MIDRSRRRWLVAACAAGGALGVSAVFPLAASLNPSERAKAAGAPVEVNIEGLTPGEMFIVEWRGSPVWVVHRTSEMLNHLASGVGELADPGSKRFYKIETPSYCRNAYRARMERKEVLVAVGICPHLGCSPTPRFQVGSDDPSLPGDWLGGYLCPCHGSTFDLSGRVYSNKPSPVNLDIPRYMYTDSHRLLIGRDEDGEA